MKLTVKCLLVMAAAMPVFAQVTARGVFLDTGDDRKPAVKFNVLLDRDGEKKVVPANYSFRSGDRMKFRFEMNRDNYIYVLHSSIETEQADRYLGEKGIDIIRDEGRRGQGKASYQLLFPTEGAGQSNLIKQRTVKSVPTGETAFFRMDENPGVEKLLVVVSPKPIDIAKYFDVRGKLRSGGTGGERSGERKSRKDTDDDVLGQLSRTLMDITGNATVDARGIDVVDDYASPKNSAKPMLITVDLRHVR